jgi:hypothetical protein
MVADVGAQASRLRTWPFLHSKVSMQMGEEARSDRIRNDDGFEGDKVGDDAVNGVIPKQ